MRHSRRYELAAIPICERTWLNDDRNRASVLHCSQNNICIINVGEPARSKLDTKRLSRSCGRIKPVFSVRPIGMPQIVYRRLRLAQFDTELHILAAQVCKDVAEARDVAARMGKACDKFGADRVTGGCKYNRNSRSMALRHGRCGGTPGYKNCRTALHELADSLRIIRFIRNPSNINRHIAILN